MKTIEVVMTEEELRGAYLKVATLTGWSLQYHTHDSRHSAKGFCDDVLVNPDKQRIVFIEAKSADGKVTPAQREWHDALAMCDQEIYLVRPDDLDELTDILTLGHKPTVMERMNYNSAVVAFD